MGTESGQYLPGGSSSESLPLCVLSQLSARSKLFPLDMASMTLLVRGLSSGTINTWSRMLRLGPWPGEHLGEAGGGRQRGGGGGDTRDRPGRPAGEVPRHQAKLVFLRGPQ
jgi:hypothetical protein